jgi:hypothetical protein
MLLYLEEDCCYMCSVAPLCHADAVALQAWLAKQIADYRLAMLCM